MLAFSREDEAPQHRSNTEHAEIIPGDITNGNATRAGTGAQSREISLKTRHFREGVRAGAIIQQIRIRKISQKTAVLHLLSHHHKARRISHRKRAQSERIHNAKNGGVGADTERESQYGDKSESRILAQHSEGMARVLQESLEDVNAARFAAFFLSAFNSTELDAGAAQCFLT